MITITITIDGENTHVLCDAVASDSTEDELKVAAIILAATDTVQQSLEDGRYRDVVAGVCQPNLKQRLMEAGLQ